jgi:hypothetical protein
MGSTVLTLVGGALVTEFFTWYGSRPVNTVVESVIRDTRLETGADVTGLVPNLKLQVGNETLPVINIYAIEIGVKSGPYVDSADIAIVFPANIRFLSKVSAEAPSPVHHISCKPLSNGVECTISPLKQSVGYRVLIATTETRAPKTFIAARNVELENIDLTMDPLAALAYSDRATDMNGEDSTSNTALIFFILFGLAILIVCWQIMWPICRHLANAEREKDDYDRILYLLARFLRGIEARSSEADLRDT